MTSLPKLAWAAGVSWGSRGEGGLRVCPGGRGGLWGALGGCGGLRGAAKDD